MRGNRSLVFLGYVAVEAAALYWVWAAFGAVGVVSVLLGGFLLGMLVMRIAGIQAFSALTDAQRRAAAFGVTGADGSEQVVHSAGPTQADARETAEEVGKSSLLFVAGILLAAPGILSGVAGLLLILPPVRAHLTRRMARSMRATADQRTRITVVTADEAGFTAQQWTASTRRDQQPSDPGRGEGGRPPVIQGEILPPPREGD